MPYSPQRFSYLQHILRDSVMPFRYRNRIRTLLGMPDCDGATVGHHYSGSAIPVEFRYQQLEVPAQKDSDADGAVNEPPRFWLGAQTAGVQRNVMSMKYLQNQTRSCSQITSVAEPFLGVFSPPRDSSSIQNKRKGPYLFRTPAKPGGGPTDKTPSQALPNPDPSGTHDSPLASATHNQQVDAEGPVRRHSRIEIPGSSSGRKSFSLLSDDARDDRSEDQTQGLPLANSFSLLSDGHPDRSRSTKAQDPIHGKASTSKQPSPLNIDSPIPAETPGNYERLLHESSFRTKAPKLAFTHDSAESLGMKIKPNQTMSYRIEQLQQAVQELTRKQSRQRSSGPNEFQSTPSPKLPPTPSQPVSGGQPTPRRLRTPDAFWERSRLGRMPVRLLR